MRLAAMNRALFRCLLSLSATAAATWLWKRVAHQRTRLQKREARRTSGQTGAQFSSLAGPLHDAWHMVGKVRIFSRYAVHQHGAVNLPLVLVHGFGVSGRYFIPLAKRLAGDYPVYVPDLPGHGRSGTPASALDISGLAQALLTWLDQLGLHNCVLLGQSMGAQIVVEAAMRQPHRFAGLVLIGPTSDPDASLATHLARLLRVAPYERPSLFGILVLDYLRMGWRLIPECRALLNDPIAKKLERLTLPVLLMKGARDALVPDAWFETLRKKTLTPHTVIMAGGGHAVQHSAPDRVALALRPYLQYVADREGRRETRTALDEQG